MLTTSLRGVFSIIDAIKAADALPDARTYACGVFSCHGTSESSINQLVQLQALLNAFSGVAGFTKIKLDGEIGGDSRRAFLAVNKWLASKGAWDPQTDVTKEQLTIASLVGGLNAELQRRLPMITATPTTTPTTPTTTTPTTPGAGPTVTQPNVATAPPGTKPKAPADNTLSYAAGTVGGLVLLYAAFHFSKKHATPSASAPTAAMAGARRRRRRG